MRILGLDPGEATGHATLDFDLESVVVIDYGTIPIPTLVFNKSQNTAQREREPLVKGIDAWLKRNAGATIVVLNEVTQIPGLPSSHKALEAQGVCRLFADEGYHPSTVHSILHTSKKTGDRTFVQEALGRKLQGATDHVYDAIAVAMAHAIRAGVWYPKHVTLPQPKQAKAKKLILPEDLGELTADEIAERLRTGRAKVARR